MSNSTKGSLDGKVALITGANSGIGRVTALELAKRGAEVFLACRSEEKTMPIVDEIARAGGKAVFLPLDLSDFASTRACADSFLRRDRPLHLLVNNAGLAGGRGLTPSGFELHFGVNHLGHFLLTTSLLERIRASAPARIVTVASVAHYQAKGIDFAAVQKRTQSRLGLDEYRVSKLANVLFSVELARRTAATGVAAYALHPGVVASNIWRRVPRIARGLMELFMISNEEGAKTTIYCATSPDVGSESGLYYEKCRAKDPAAPAKDPALASELWRRSGRRCLY